MQNQNETFRRGSELCGCFATLPFGTLLPSVAMSYMLGTLGDIL